MNATKISVEDLLKPRYILENEWFDCPYPNGTILVKQSHSNGFGPEMWIPGQHTFLQSDLDKYPYLVRKLNWWEEREPGEMPQYLVVNLEKHSGRFDGDPDILKVKEHFKSGPGARGLHNQSYQSFTSENGLSGSYSYSGYLPATESEYINYINTTPSKGGE